MKKQIKKYNGIIITAFILGWCFAGPAGAQTPAGSWQGQGVPLQMGPSSTEANQEGVKVKRTLDGRYYLDFKAAPLITVLNVLSSLSGINFVAGNEIAQRQVNMTLDNVSLEDALQSIALGCNVSYEKLDGRNIYIFRASSNAPDLPPLITRVFKFYYVRVSKLKEIADAASDSSGGGDSGGLVTLEQDDDDGDIESSAIYQTVENILSDRGTVSVDDRSNSLVVTDTEDRLRMIGGAISQLDQPLDQVLINVFLIETFEDLNRALGLRWGDANGVFGTIYGGTENTSFPFFTKPGSNNSLGNWYTQLTRQFDPTANTAPGVGPNASVIPAPGAGTGGAGVRDFTHFQIQLTALEAASKVRVLAKPKILVLDNHPALIKIATNSAIGSSTTTTGGGSGTTTGDVERSETGTILRVTPLINLRDQITMTVEPTFATVAPSAINVANAAGSVGATGDTTTRQARTTLMVNDGQTIAIGGLLFSTQTKGDRKVPFFGNIPLIGKAFFTDASKIIQDRELILFITPFIIRDPSVLETPTVPDHRMSFNQEKAPFWKLKEKSNFKALTTPPEPRIDYDQYFDVRKRLMDATLETLDSGSR